MKKSKISLILIACFMLISFNACDNENSELSGEAEMILSFNVIGTSGIVFRGDIGDDRVVTIKVSPSIDEQEELNGAHATFFISQGASVTPDPSEPQNFAQVGGVKYTITSENGKNQNVYTVLCGISDQMPHGEGFSYAEIGMAKTFPELGYPGQQGNTGLPSIEYGDVNVYMAYCGDFIVLLSRRYIDDVDPASPHAIKVVDKTNLDPGPAFNLGSISPTNLRMITSDYNGRCVGAVVTGEETEFFYWTAPTAAPVSIGKIAVNMAPSTDGSANFQVAGDITGNAWITALAPRGVDGNHYRVQITNGSLASNYSMISTGFPSNDGSLFQMISPLDDTENPRFLIGDAEGTPGQNNTAKGYIKTYTGLTVATMPPIWQTLNSWWVGTGVTTERGGGRSPFISALPINGKSYVIVVSGSMWWTGAAVLEDDLETLAHPNLNIPIEMGISRGWSWGSWADWYWDDENNEAHLALWVERFGLFTYKMTCFE